MKSASIEQQLHGYRFGHELLASSVQLPRSDQQVIDRISDLSGPVGPGEMFSPYLTAYPLSSGSHFVLARTWQDQEAKRAGCVLTRSLLIPMDVWRSAWAPSAFVKHLTPFSSDSVEVQSLVADSDSGVLPLFDYRRSYDLVEALFLEKKEPIIVFELDEAELISLRTVTSLWPNARAVFSFCTYAAGPRTVDEGRPFNLLFAPKSSRSRFSSWPARRVELKSNNTEGRHRWTSILARRIFDDPHPSLMEMESLGFFGLQNGDHESALRLSLLWSELVERSKSSVTAVLGMLDILASQAVVPSEMVIKLNKAVVTSLTKAVVELPVREAWSFVLLLSVKPALRSLKTGVELEIRNCSSVLTSRAESVALEVLASEAVPEFVVGGIADGIAEDRKSNFAQVLESVASGDLRRLLRTSEKFVRAAVSRTDADTPPDRVLAVAAHLKTVEKISDQQFLESLLICLENDAQSPYLAALLQHPTPVFTSIAVRSIYRLERNLPIEYFSIFDRATAGIKAHEALLQEIVALPNAAIVSEFLSHVLRINELDLKWLTRKSGLSIKQTSSILARRLTQTDVWKSPTLSEELTQMILDVFAGKLSSHSNVIAEVLMHSVVSVEQLFEVGTQVLSTLTGTVAREFNLYLTRRGLLELSDNSPAFQALQNCLTQGIDDLPSIEIISLICSSESTSSRVVENLWILINATSNKSTQILESIDKLSDRLISESYRLPDEVFEPWSILVKKSRRANSIPHESAVQTIFPFALKLVNRHASSLMVAVFPTLYIHLDSERASGNLFAFFFNQQWNLSAAAREDLVDAYMSSIWPPADLLLIAVEAEVVNEIIGLVNSKKQGNKYLKAIISDLDRMPREIRGQLEVDLSQAKRKSK